MSNGQISLHEDSLEFLRFSIYGGLNMFDSHQKVILKYVLAILTDNCTSELKNDLIVEFISKANYAVTAFEVDFDVQAEALLSTDSKFNSIEKILMEYILLEFKQKRLEPHYSAHNKTY